MSVSEKTTVGLFEDHSKYMKTTCISVLDFVPNLIRKQISFNFKLGWIWLSILYYLFTVLDGNKLDDDEILITKCICFWLVQGCYILLPHLQNLVSNDHTKTILMF